MLVEFPGDPLAFGDVFLDRDIVGNLAAGIEHRGDDGELDILGAILALVEQFPFPRPPRHQRLPKLDMALGRGFARMQDARILADDLGPAVAGGIEEGIVYIFDFGVEIGDHDAFRALFDGHRQLVNLVLGPHPLGHVVHDGVDHLPLTDLDRPAERFDIAHGAVGSPMPEAEMIFMLQDGTLHFGADLLRRERIDPGNVHAGQHLPAPAVIFRCRLVGIENGAIHRVDDQHHAMAAQEERPVTRFAVLDLTDLGLQRADHVVEAAIQPGEFVGHVFLTQPRFQVAVGDPRGGTINIVEPGFEGLEQKAVGQCQRQADGAQQHDDPPPEFALDVAHDAADGRRNAGDQGIVGQADGLQDEQPFLPVHPGHDDPALFCGQRGEQALPAAVRQGLAAPGIGVRIARDDIPVGLKQHARPPLGQSVAGSQPIEPGNVGGSEGGSLKHASRIVDRVTENDARLTGYLSYHELAARHARPRLDFAKPLPVLHIDRGLHTERTAKHIAIGQYGTEVGKVFNRPMKTFGQPVAFARIEAPQVIGPGHRRQQLPGLPLGRRFFQAQPRHHLPGALLHTIDRRLSFSRVVVQDQGEHWRKDQ